MYYLDAICTAGNKEKEPKTSLKKGDEFQARATLQSLKDYYQVENDGIIDEVNSRLDEINRESSTNRQAADDNLNN